MHSLIVLHIFRRYIEQQTNGILPVSNVHTCVEKNTLTRRTAQGRAFAIRALCMCIRKLLTMYIVFL